MELTMTNSFCELNENEMMETDGGIAIIPLVLALGIVLSLTGCSASEPRPYGTNSHGVDYDKATYNLHKKTECNIDSSYCPSGKECPFA